MLLFPEKLDLLLIPNSMAQTTALLFTLAGILLLNSYSNKKANRIVNDVLLIIAFLISYLGVIGYIYSLESFYRIGPFKPMALNTSISFMLLFVSLFLTLPAGYLNGIFFSKLIGGKLVRKAIPLILLIPPVYGYSHLIIQRAQIYKMEYVIALDTGLIVLVVLLVMFYYAGVLNRNDFVRKVAEQAVAKNEEKFRSLVFALKEGIIYFNKDGKILFYNPGMAEMTGYSLHELIGRNIVDTFSPDEHKIVSLQLMNDVFSGIAEEFESVIIHKDGTKLKVFITAKPIDIDKNGKPTSFLSTVNDITERKKREEDIEAFSASAAHDLNAPLSRIEGLTGIILQSAKDRLNKDDTECLEIVLKTTMDMRQLLKDLLIFYRMGIDKINKAPVDMNKMVNEVISNASAPQTKFHVANLPDCFGEKATLKQVWTNLVLNAIKYSSKNEHPEVTIGCFEEHGKTVYFVKDNGVGFDMAEFPKLFAPFKRLHTDFEGNGLGLPIVKRIVEKHGGKIWAESEVQKGATFYFTL